jgi:hypothetical protein
MITKECLNCGTKLTDKYCSGCGQLADIQRITFKNFIFNDVLHGTFHIERGILFTAKESLTRPGKAALDYISGKRKRYYNVFYLILITIALMLFTRHVTDWFASKDQVEEVIQAKTYINEASQKIDELLKQKNKIIIFLFVPFGAVNSFILFRRKKLNLSEHSIIAGMILLGVLLLSTFSNILFWFKLVHQIGMVISILITALIIIYIGFGYCNAFGSEYSKLGIAYRIVLFYALLCLEILLLTFIIVGIFTHWEFGEFQITPFG